MALTVSILSSCSDQDNLCYCPYDKFFSEALDADSYTLYRRCYASLRSTDGEIIHSPVATYTGLTAPCPISSDAYST